MEKQLLPHQQRVVDELAELQDKVNKLSIFIDTNLFQELSHTDRHLLTTQLDAMRVYGNILAMRIDRF